MADAEEARAKAEAEKVAAGNRASEVPVGSETPSWVKANVAVGGGGVSEAQDQQGRGAGSVTERPSPAQLNLKRVRPPQVVDGVSRESWTGFEPRFPF